MHIDLATTCQLPYVSVIQLEIFNKTRTRIRKDIFQDLLLDTRKWLSREKKITSHGRSLKIELTFVGTAFMRQLNLLYHKKNRSTDVISLSYFSKKMHDPFVGEIFICLPYAKKQAQEIRQPFLEELRFLFVHGVLHLFGYDHKKQHEEKRMLKLTYRILGRK